MQNERVIVGIERLLSDRMDAVRGQRVGLVCNQASVMPDTLAHSADVFFADPEMQLTTLFGPQHGIRGDVQDNMIETDHSVDPRTGLPVYSLYSETREPTEEMVRDIDTFVIDLQDVGCRIYTFVYTMANCMRAAKRSGKRVVVCDRPNPIGGVAIEGNITEDAFKSFVGQFELPTRHGMTIGELAWMFNEHFGIGCELEVIAMEGWERTMWGDQTGLPWILPSPNIPTVDTCVAFPATVHIEGTELSEGRGTTKPFELNGAPFIDPYEWVDALDAFGFDGVRFRHVFFRPTFQKWAEQTCGGVQIHVTDREAFTPVAVGIAMVKTAYDLYRDKFEWKRDAYEYEFDKNPFDVVCGSDSIRRQIESGTPLADIRAAWAAGESEFAAARQPYLLY